MRKKPSPRPSPATNAGVFTHGGGRERESEEVGFTLIEILVALFIFSLLSLMLASSLHTIIKAQTAMEEKAERLRHLQFVLLRMSRDIEQIAAVPTKTLTGTSQGFSFTRSSIEQVRYFYHNHALWRMALRELEKGQKQTKLTREILKNVLTLNFQYLDQENHFQDKWPVQGTSTNTVPKAISVSLSLASWGKMSQIYVIPTQTK